MDIHMRSQVEVLKALKAQRAAALVREVSMLARVPNPALGISGFPALVAQAQQARGPAPFHASAANGLGGPARREVRRAQPKPYERVPPPIPLSIASRTASTVSHCSLREDESNEIRHPTLSPLNSPELRSCVSLLATPELIGIVVGDKRCPLPPKLSLSAPEPPQPQLDASELRASLQNLANMDRDDPADIEPMGQSWSQPSGLGSLGRPGVPCPSPTPTTGQIDPRKSGEVTSPTPERKPLYHYVNKTLLRGGDRGDGSIELPRRPSLSCLDMLGEH